MNYVKERSISFDDCDHIKYLFSYAGALTMALLTFPLGKQVEPSPLYYHARKLLDA
jgi:hypothetical protein